MKTNDWLPFFLLGTFALACDYAKNAPWPPPFVKKRSMRFQVDPTSTLHPYAVAAAARWSSRLGRPITVSADGDVPIFYMAEDPVPFITEDGRSLYAGARAVYEYDGGPYIEVAPHSPKSELLAVMMHEMGHLLRGDPQPGDTTIHVDNDPKALMYPELTTQRDITDADVRFICERFECAPGIPAHAPV